MWRLKGRKGGLFIDLTNLPSVLAPRQQAKSARWGARARTSRGIALGFLIGWLGGTALTPTNATSEQDSLYKQASRFYQEVRCPVCLGQSIAESDTPESLSLKHFILREFSKGASEELLRIKLRNIYGEDILFSPPFTEATFILWLAPFGLLCILCLLIGYKLFKTH